GSAQIITGQQSYDEACAIRPFRPRAGADETAFGSTLARATTKTARRHVWGSHQIAAVHIGPADLQPCRCQQQGVGLQRLNVREGRAFRTIVHIGLVLCYNDGSTLLPSARYFLSCSREAYGGGGPRAYVPSVQGHRSSPVS